MKNRKIAVLYHHYLGTPDGEENLDFFLKNGVVPTCDYFFNIVGASSVIQPPYENCRFYFSENDDMDYGGFRNLINNYIDICKYEFFIFLNSTVRGPYYKANDAKNEANWSEHFISPLNGDIHLSGAAISILHPSSPHAQDFHAEHNSKGVIPHVQSMAYTMTRQLLEMLLAAGFFDRSLNNSRNNIISGYELFLSTLVLKVGYNISASLPRYQNIDYRTLTFDFNPTSVNGDALFPGAYFGNSVDPFDNLFVKTRRNYVDLSSVDLMDGTM